MQIINMDFNDIGLIIGIVSLIFTVFFGWNYAKHIPLKTENENLKEQIKKLTSEIQKEKRKTIQANIKSDLPEKYRDINNDKDLIAYAKNNTDVTEVKILGINALGPVHRAREEIKGCLENGKQVRILLLNPYSDNFINRIREVECKSYLDIEDYSSHLERLMAEWYATIYNLKNIEKNVHDINIKKLLQVKMRDETPKYAFTAITTKNSQGIALLNVYPDTGRGIEGRQSMACEILPHHKYDYDTCINNSKSLGKNQKISHFSAMVIIIRIRC